MYDMSLYLKKIDDVISKGPYSDDWNSLSAYKVPEWYRRAKFGIFIHVHLETVVVLCNGDNIFCS